MKRNRFKERNAAESGNGVQRTAAPSAAESGNGCSCEQRAMPLTAAADAASSFCLVVTPSLASLRLVSG